MPLSSKVLRLKSQELFSHYGAYTFFFYRNCFEEKRGEMVEVYIAEQKAPSVSEISSFGFRKKLFFSSFFIF